jgi:hypothetical protein
MRMRDLSNIKPDDYNSIDNTEISIDSGNSEEIKSICMKENEREYLRDKD